MNEAGQSHSPVVPAKPANKATGVAAELVEERGLTKGNTESPARSGHRAGIRVPRGLERVRQVAGRDKEMRFTALLHHVTVELLGEGFQALRREAAPGVDGMTWEAYAAELEGNLQELHDRLHRGAYRAKPSRRVFIPQADGGRGAARGASLGGKNLQWGPRGGVNGSYRNDFRCLSFG